MSLLIINSQEKEIKLAQKAFEKHLQKDEKLAEEYDERRKKHMLQDIVYNLKCLNTALKYDETKLFEDHALWVYKLLVNRMKDLPPERIKEQMVTHYIILKKVLEENLPQDTAQKASQFLKMAIKVTEQASFEDMPLHEDDEEGEKLSILRKQYLQAILDKNRRGASKIINDAVKDGAPLEDIYVYVFQKTMNNIGNLWHEGSITIDVEHYCTAVTQGIMAQFYSLIFATPRKNYSMLACCVGNELHEMGIRMLCDLFELNGWDTIYLGAAVPTDSILHAIIENKPHLVALSVTMPHHIEECQEIVSAVKNNPSLKNIKIAVGGRAFLLAPGLYKKLGADIFTTNGLELIEWVNANFNSK